MIKNIAGKNIVRIRQERGYSCKELARRVSLRGHPTLSRHMGNMERGICPITDIDLLFVSRALNVSPVELLYEQPVIPQNAE